MFDWFARRRMDAFESHYGYDMTYVRQMWGADTAAAMAYARATKLLARRGALPANAYHAARVVAGRAADCGPCLQLAVTMAEQAGVPRDVLTALLTRRHAELPRDIALVADFVEASLARTLRAEELRAAVRERFGQAGLVRIALVMAAAHVYPIVKFALGYGHACARTRVGDVWVSPAPFEVAAE
jgi:alkylhydroperoxidase family enzyme